MIVPFLSLFLVCVAAKNLPPEITKCRKDDPKLAECLMNAVHVLKSGNKDLGVIPLEPLFITKIDLGNSSSGAVSIHQEYENMKLFGITNVEITNIEMNSDDDNCYFRFNSHGSEVRMESDYRMTGQILVFPINGHGKCNNSLYDFTASYDVKCEKYVKRNKKHVRVTDLKFTMRPKKVVFNYENIVDGNEQLSKEVEKTVNENALAVYADAAPGFDAALAQIFKGIMNQVYSRVPEDELFLS